MLVVTGTFEIAETDVDEARRLATEMAAATRQEKGCRTYAFFQDIEEPTRFRVYEEWDDEAALEAHFRTPHMAQFRGGLAKIDVRSRQIYKFHSGEMTAL